jgi:hypothetical protein
MTSPMIIRCWWQPAPMPALHPVHVIHRAYRRSHRVRHAKRLGWMLVCLTVGAGIGGAGSVVRHYGALGLAGSAVGEQRPTLAGTAGAAVRASAP